MAALPPTPPPSSEAVRQRMVGQRRADTAPELALRRALHRRGLRYQVHRRPEPALRRTADLVFKSTKTVVEVRGCFWHACPLHGSMPKANSGWWREKLTRTKARDDETDRVLRAAGWEVVVVWEHEDAAAAAERVAAVIAARRVQPGAKSVRAVYGGADWGHACRDEPGHEEQTPSPEPCRVGSRVRKERDMHTPTDVRDAFLDLLDGTVPDDSTALWGLTGQLWNCTDRLPDWACAELELRSGATFACGARAWRRARRRSEAAAS